MKNTTSSSLDYIAYKLFGDSFGRLSQYHRHLCQIHRTIMMNNGMDYLQREEYLNETAKLEWKPVPGYKAEVTTNAAYIRSAITGNILDPINSTGGYWHITIKNDNDEKATLSIHRAMALACIPNDDPVNKTQVNHIDGDKWNNLPGNLEWASPSENMCHALRTGLLHPAKGTSKWNNKYTEKQVRQVCQLLQDRPDLTLKEIAELTGVNVRSIGPIFHGGAWAHVSKDYVFKDRKSNSIHRGETNALSRYTDKQIKQVCHLLNDVYLDKTRITHKEIAKISGTSVDVVDKINSGKTWTHISKNYEFYQAKFN